jgi:hypothetical protein
MERMVLPWPPNNGTTRSAVVNADGNFFSNPDAGYQPWGIVPERTVPYRPTPVAPTAQTSLNKSRTGGRRPWHIAGPARPGHHTQQRTSIALFSTDYHRHNEQQELLHDHTYRTCSNDCPRNPEIAERHCQLMKVRRGAVCIARLDELRDRRPLDDLVAPRPAIGEGDPVGRAPMRQVPLRDQLAGGLSAGNDVALCALFGPDCWPKSP